MLDHTTHVRASCIGKAYNCLSNHFIDGSYVPCYEVFGQPCIIAEDLRSYGYSVDWDVKNRKLIIKASNIKVCTYDNIKELERVMNNILILNKYAKGSLSPYQIPLDNNKEIVDYINKGYEGQSIPSELKELLKPVEAFDIYQTDIKVYYNDRIITAYSIGGKMLVPYDKLFSIQIQNQLTVNSQFYIPINQNVEVMLPYLNKQINRKSMDYSAEIHSDKLTGRYIPAVNTPDGYFTPSSSPGDQYKLNNNILFQDYYTSIRSQFSNDYKNGYFCRYSTDELTGILRYYYYFYEVGIYKNSILNGAHTSIKSSCLVTDGNGAHDPFYDTLYSSGIYENGLLRDGALITVNYYYQNYPVCEITLKSVSNFHEIVCVKNLFNAKDLYRVVFF